MTETNANTTFKISEDQQPIAIASSMEYNVEAIAEMECEALHGGFLRARVSDAITGFIGSRAFVVFQILLFIGWGIVNLNFMPDIGAFNPFLFGILTLIVSAEGIFLTIFILIGQNRIADSVIARRISTYKSAFSPNRR
jgi:uncharacterized membrane protein